MIWCHCFSHNWLMMHAIPSAQSMLNYELRKLLGLIKQRCEPFVWVCNHVHVYQCVTVCISMSLCVSLCLSVCNHVYQCPTMCISVSLCLSVCHNQCNAFVPIQYSNTRWCTSVIVYVIAVYVTMLPCASVCHSICNHVHHSVCYHVS